MSNMEYRVRYRQWLDYEALEPDMRAELEAVKDN